MPRAPRTLLLLALPVLCAAWAALPEPCAFSRITPPDLRPQRLYSPCSRSVKRSPFAHMAPAECVRGMDAKNRDC